MFADCLNGINEPLISKFLPWVFVLFIRKVKAMLVLRWVSILPPHCRNGMEGLRASSIPSHRELKRQRWAIGLAMAADIF
jgi:hypothetical protein